MDVSLKWLSKYVDISGYSPKELADKITVCGVEVEEIKYLAQGSNLVIGKVLTCVSHPDSDHLHVCNVDVGNETLQIVCGAPNVASGQKVIVSLPGAVLPAKGITITKGSIRGVESNGMICSLLELGVDKKYLSEEQCNGIEVLGEDAVVGDKDPLKYLGLDDVIFELKPTPNRGDVLSVMSFAYEVAACLGRKANVITEEIKFDKLLKPSFTVDSKTDKCHYFSIKGVKGVKTKESPKWLKEALIGCGIRSINNIVDIGNYVMLLTGQPLHMYDSDKLPGNDYCVRDDFEEDYVALDDKSYSIQKGDLVVTNNSKISCIAGVMGGKNTEVDDESSNLAIEAAIFDSVAVRKTSTRLELISDSSTRFVRGIDESRSLYALDLAAKLLIDLADAKEVEETVSYGKPIINQEKIVLTLDRVNGLLGTNFTLEQVKDVFNRLAFRIEDIDTNSIMVTPPTYRKDIFASEDLVEEVIRLLGFDNLVATYPVTSNVGSLTFKQKLRKRIRNHLLVNGINEALNYSLVNESMNNDFNCLEFSKQEPVKILHPLTEDHSIMRRSVVPSLLKSINYNYYHSINNVKLFEFTNLYTQIGSKEVLGIALSGNNERIGWNKNSNEKYSFYHMKGLIVGMLAKLGIDENRYSLVRIEEDNKFYHIGASAYIKTGNVVWGVFGEVHPNIIKKYDIPNTIVAEIDFDYLNTIKTGLNKFVAPSIYPDITRDIALVVDKDIDASSIIKVIKKNSKGLVKDVNVFDEYKGEHVGENKKSVALHINYHSDKQTLKDNDIKPVHESILEALAKELKAELRG